MKRCTLLSTCNLFLVGPLFAADVRVPQDYTTIQAAIDAAQVGDRVLVGPGVYAEQIDFLGKDILVESTDGAAQTVIDGQGALGYVVSLAGAQTRAATLRGFTVTGGYGELGSLSAGPGGGILVGPGGATIDAALIEANVGGIGAAISMIEGDLLLRDSVLSDNAAVFGGAIASEGGTLTIERSEFIGNRSSSSGGALSLNWGTVAQIRDSRFEGNLGQSLGGALYAGNTQLQLVGNEFVGNGAAEPGEDGVSWIFHTLGGGAVYVTASSGRIQGNRMLDNVASFGSGLYVAGSDGLLIVNNLIAGNDIDCNCSTGGVYLNSASPSLINNTIADNGGFFGIYTTYNSFANVSNSIISGHQVPVGGNGLLALGYSLYDGESSAASLGEGNLLVTDPLLDPGADYAPLAGSPVIDAGSNAALPADVQLDLLGNLRRIDDPSTPDSGQGNAPIVDIGAIEFDPSGGTSVHDRIFSDHFQPGV